MTNWVDSEIQEILNFVEHMENSVTEMLSLTDEEEERGERDKYDLEIKMNGKSINLHLHAELYQRLLIFFEEELEELCL